MTTTPPPARFAARPQSSGASAPIGPVFDGLKAVAFHPRTLQIGVRASATQETFPRPTVAGAVRLWLRRRVGDVSADRYFVLGAGEFLTLDVAPFDDLALFVQETSGLADYGVFAALYGDDGPEDKDKTALLPMRYTAAGTYPVPPGAIEAYFTVTDPAFRWLARDTSSGVDLTFALPAGFVQGAPWGDRFTLAVTPMGISWRISL